MFHQSPTIAIRNEFLSLKAGGVVFGAVETITEIEPEAEEWSREAAVVELCDCVIDLASAFFNVCGREMRQPGRSRSEIARIRQIAMYIAHTALDMSMAEVGRGFGRDRTTVLHAVHLVEDLRDEAEFDAVVGRVEYIAQTVMRGRKVGSLR